MKQYESYKDSGIEWLGKIPSHWTPISMKYYFYMKGRIGWQGLKADEFISEGPFLVTGTDFDNGKVDWSRCYHISEERYAEAPEIHVKEGDLLITKDGTVGKLAYVDYVPGKVSLNSHLLILRPLTDSVSNHFMYWALQADNFVHYTGLAQSGSIMASLSQEKIGDYKLALPSLSEQRIIASYLDDKVSQIDVTIAEKEKMIEDLQNYRKSIISETVTRGLDPNVPMKDSGVEFIGNVPESWKVVPIKYVLEQSADGIKIGPFGSTLTGKVSPNHTVKVYGQWNVIGKDFTAGKNFVSEKTYQELESYWIHPNDILISMMGTVGKCAIIPVGVPKGIMDSHIVKVRLNETVVDPQFFYYVYDKDGSNVIMSQIQRDRRGSIMDGLNSSLIKNFDIPLPPIEVQKNITNYLDNKVSLLDTSISELQSQIEDLKAYKSSLITEAVTGKIDLRNE